MTLDSRIQRLVETLPVDLDDTRQLRLSSRTMLGAVRAFRDDDTCRLNACLRILTRMTEKELDRAESSLILRGEDEWVEVQNVLGEFLDELQ